MHIEGYLALLSQEMRLWNQLGTLAHRPVSTVHFGGGTPTFLGREPLSSLGYRKTLFNHFARERDTNLYFTFPERGEDCPALGAIADGVFGDYHYRHPEYEPYCQSVDSSFPGLQGGLRRSVLENRLYPLETALLSASISLELLVDVLGRDRSGALLQHWREADLVEGDPLSGHLCLTANGPWFVSKMMAEVSVR